MPSSAARSRALPRPASESWSVRATALQPAAAASSGIRSGGSVPSETVEWVCRSIMPAEATGHPGRGPPGVVTRRSPRTRLVRERSHRPAVIRDDVPDNHW